MKRIRAENDCGCHINVVRGKCYIDYCPKHRAAHELYEVCKRLNLALKRLAPVKLHWNSLNNTALFARLREAIAKAEIEE